MRGGRPLTLSQGVLPQNWGGTEQNRTVTFMVLKATANDSRKSSPLPYTRAFGNGPRNFEPWSSDVDDTRAGTPPSPNYHTTPHQREDVSALDRFNAHRCPTRQVFSGIGLELVTRQATIRYLYHSATAATLGVWKCKNRHFKQQSTHPDGEHSLKKLRKTIFLIEAFNRTEGQVVTTVPGSSRPLALEERKHAQPQTSAAPERALERNR
ncbi:uncharacterized protein TNCV_2130881 [Trichonephila clavipes]|nr:uncharacterized protein TNCV_2130881 [Trichonephila clavipes]